MGESVFSGGQRRREEDDDESSGGGEKSEVSARKLKAEAATAALLVSLTGLVTCVGKTYSNRALIVTFSKLNLPS